MADAAKLDAGIIQDHMPVIGSDGLAVGTVDRVEGAWIKLAKNADDGGEHRYVPLSTVAGLDGAQVRLSMPAAQAKGAAKTEADMARKRDLRLEEGTGPGQVPPDDDGPHGSRAAKHGGAKGQREHGMSGQAPGPPGETSFGVHRPVPGDPGPDGAQRRPSPKT